MAYGKAQATPGPSGKSAYQSAVEMGFVGNEAEWVSTSQHLAGIIYFSLSGITNEPGYLMTDGAAVSRTLYSRLFGKIGTMFGAGDGLTTFNLPDTRGRIPIFADLGANRYGQAGNRTDRGDGTIGDAVGTIQGFQFGEDALAIAPVAGPSGIFIENMNFIGLIKY